MNRKHFLIIIAVLVALAAAGAAIVYSERDAWQDAASDARVGQRLASGFKMNDVAEVAIRDAASELHLVRGEDGWKVRERADFPADLDRIAELLLKVSELKVVQAERLPEGQRARLQLLPPGEARETKGKTGTSPAAKDAGTVLELRDAKGQLLTQLLLGKKITKRAAVPELGGREADVPVGRYLVAAGDANTMLAVSEPLVQAEPKAELWLAKDLIRAERLKSVSSVDGNGKQRWAMTRNTDTGYWRFVGAAGTPDLQKAQDVASSLGWMNLVDVVRDMERSDSGLERAVTLRATSFDNVNYTVRVGNKAGENYHVSVAVAGDPPKTRPPVKGEKPADKDKKDKEYEDYRKKLAERLEQEKKLDHWTYLVPKAMVEPLLREHAQMLPEKKAAPKQG